MIQEHPGYILVAGATDIWPKIRRGALKDADFIDLTAMPHPEPYCDGSGALHLPGAITAASLAAGSGKMLKKWPLLAEGARHLGSPQIRNRATLAGNICTASPCADMTTALSPYNPEVKLSSAAGSRLLPLKEFLTGPGRTAKAADEWLEEVILPLPPEGVFSKFSKTGRRNALIIAVASMALNILLKKGKVEHIALAFGSVAPTVLRAQKVEEFLLGKELSADLIAQAADIAYNEVKPINDQRATAEYRRQVCRDFLAAALEEAAQ